MKRTVRVVGDIHGKLDDFEDLYKYSPKDETIQVGDFGIGFQGPAYMPVLPSNVKFIRGNHDNPAMCKVHANCIQDGTFRDDLNAMFVGGAWSIDLRFRTPGFDWWPEEELNHVEFGRVVERYELIKPDVMITHDFPRSASDKMFFDSGLINGKQYEYRTASYFEDMFRTHKPKLWIGGHWHFDVDMVIEGTRFICLNELSYLDFEVNDGVWDQIGA